jgi:hypothetical protein
MAVLAWHRVITAVVPEQHAAMSRLLVDDH